MAKTNRGLALIVDDDKVNRAVLQALLKKNGFDILNAENGEQAVSLFRQNDIDIVFMDVMMPVMDGYQATTIIKSICAEKDIFVPVIFLTALTDEDSLSKCIDAGGDDFISKPFNITILNSKIYAIERVRDMSRKLRSMYARLQNDEELAEKVFSNAVLAENVQSSELKSIVRSADIFSGDMFITAYSPSRDVNLVLGDFTGHGLASALGALPASEAFRAMTAKGYSLPDILKTINVKLYNLLPTGMFMACIFVSIDHELNHVSVCNCGMPPVYIKSERGIIEVKSTCLPLGIDPGCDYSGHIEYVPTEMGDRLIVISDGVIEARNEEDIIYDSQRLLETISQPVHSGDFIIDKVYEDLEQFCGTAKQYDDISIAEIILRPDLLPSWDIASISKEKSNDIEIQRFINDDMPSVEFSINSCGANINKLDPIPQIVNNISQAISTTNHSQSLFTILTELYVNALDHGVLGLDSKLKSTPEGFAQYFQNREQALNLLQDGYIKLNIQIKEYAERYIVIIRVEDSGNGFDISKVTLSANGEKIQAFGRGISLVQNLCDSLHYEMPGNIAQAIYVCSKDHA